MISLHVRRNVYWIYRALYSSCVYSERKYIPNVVMYASSRFLPDSRRSHRHSRTHFHLFLFSFILSLYKYRLLCQHEQHSWIRYDKSSFYALSCSHSYILLVGSSSQLYGKYIFYIMYVIYVHCRYHSKCLSLTFHATLVSFIKHLVLPSKQHNDSYSSYSFFLFPS